METKLLMEKELNKLKILLERRENKNLIQLFKLMKIYLKYKLILKKVIIQMISKKDFLNQTFTVNNNNSQELKNIKEKMNIFENKIEELKNKINLFNYIIQ